MRSARRVVLLAGPSGSGKSPLARASGLPVITLDDFYRDGDDPALPRHSEPGIVDWDHPDAWDAARAIETLVAICADGTANIPVRRLLRDLVNGANPRFRCCVGALPCGRQNDQYCAVRSHVVAAR